MYCKCGCGNLAPIASYTRNKWGYKKGQPVNFIRGHAKPNNGVTHDRGYVKVLVGKEHPMADHHGYCRENRLVMSQHLGRPLESDETVHHINEIKDDNRIENLQLFATKAEHAAYHGFQRGSTCK